MSRSPAPFDQGVYLIHLHKGKEYFDQNLLEKAREELESAYQLRPQDEKIQNLLGMTYYKLELLPQAEEMYVNLSINNPEIHTLQSNLGLIRLKLNKLDQAEEALGRAMELQPTNAKVHFYLGLLYEKKEQWEDALLHFEQARAEKMASRMRTIIEGKIKDSRDAILPFEVLEVIEEEPAGLIHPPQPELSTQQEVSVSPEAEEADQAPQSLDAAESMVSLDEQEVADEEAEEINEAEFDSESVPAVTDQEEWKKWVQDTGKFKLKEFLESIRQEETADEEELVEDLTPLEESTIEEKEERSPWEKTHPGILNDVVSAPEATQQVTSSYLPDSSMLEQPFFLAEEVAADISTFLAQSRDEHMQDEVFVFDDPEPHTPSLIAVTQEVVLPENFMTVEPFEDRIPTPEEVETSIAASAVEPEPSMVEDQQLNEISSELISQELNPEPQEPSSLRFEEQAQDVAVPESAAPAEFSSDTEMDVEESVEFEIIDDMTDASEEASVAADSPTAVAESAPEEARLSPDDFVAEATSADDQQKESAIDETQQAQEIQNPQSQVLAAESVTSEEDHPAEEAVEEISEEADLISDYGGNQEAVVEAPEEEPGLIEVSSDPAPYVPPVEPSWEETQELSLVKGSNFLQTEIADAARKDEEELEELADSYQEFPAANLDQFSRDRFYVQPLVGSDRFLLIDPHLLEVIISDQLLCRVGTVSSYTGNLQFTTWRENMPLVHVKGSGMLFLADRRKELFLLSLNNEAIYVHTNHLLVAQSVLKVEPFLIHHKSGQSSFSMVRVSGRGTLALTCQTKPLTLNIQQTLPANIPSHAVIAWSGNLISTILDDAELNKILMKQEGEGLFLRFTGSGDVVVEQGGLWGDRRGKRQ